MKHSKKKLTSIIMGRNLLSEEDLTQLLDKENTLKEGHNDQADSASET